LTISRRELIETAQLKAGLDDWGSEDFLAPLGALIDSLNKEAELTASGERATRQCLLLRLTQRLRLFEDRKRYRAICEQRIERPIIVTGFPRAGTTFMHALLAADPNAIAPRFWQLLSPSPPPNAAAFEHATTIKAMEKYLRGQGILSDKILITHDFDIATPEECCIAFEQAMVAGVFAAYWNVPSYLRSIEGKASQSYDMHYKILQAMQLGTQGKHWVLKASEHCWNIEALLQRYPDAILIIHHRDPAKVLASLLSLRGFLRGCYSEKRMDLETIKWQFRRCVNGMLRADELRRCSRVKNPIIDVHYRGLENDPMRTLENVYEQASLPMGPAAKLAIQKTIAARYKGRHGAHKYSLEQHGLSADEVRASYRDYIGKFAPDLEAV
jgi:hypothetical protein